MASHSLALPPSSFPLTFHHQHRSRQLPRLLCRSSNKKKDTSFTDRILDYIEGGPKLRKWYGAPDLLPKDAASEAEEDGYREIDYVRDAILVTDGESELGQLVILLLILKRARIKALVRDKKAAIEAFGTYVESMAGDIRDKSFITKALRGVRAIICPSNDGFFSEIGQMKGVQHIVILSQLAVYRSSGIRAILNNNAMKLAERDEEVVTASGVPYTIIRAGLLQNSPGGTQGFCFNKGVAAEGKLSKEDAAFICVEALDTVPQTGLDFEVVNGDDKVLDWKEWFAIKTNEELQLPQPE